MPIKLARLLATASVVAALMLTAACGSSGGTTSSSGDFCNEIKDTQANKELGNALQNSKSISVLKKNYAKANSKIKDLASSAPSEIKKDMRTVADGFQKLTDTVNESTSLQDFGRRATKLTNDLKSFEPASSRLDAWQKKNCKGTKK